MFGGKVTDIHVSNGISVPEFCLRDEPNLNARPRMEDDHIVEDGFNLDPQFGLFAVLDGHGGPEIANFISKNMPKTEALLRMLGAQDIGATCCAAYFCKENSQRVFYIANLGDTRAIVSRNGQAVRITTDHKASEPSEISRVQSQGGMIINNRLGGKLAITRSFGDFALKRMGLSAEPEIHRQVIGPSDGLLVIATDGLWDVIDDQAALEITKNFPGLKEKAKALIDFALHNGSKDNITVFIARLN